MIPSLFNIGPFPINTFGLMIACSLLIAIKVLENSFQTVGIRKELAEKFAMTGGIGGLIGARIWYIFENFSESRLNILGAIFSSAGFTFYGGLIISSIIMFFLCRKHNIPFTQFLNAVGPTMTIGYCVGRLGCQLSGDGDYGLPTESIFGMSFLTGVVPTLPGVLVFPTPLYESLWCAVVLPFLFYVERRSQIRNTFWDSKLSMRPFGIYLVTVSTERFFVEFLRRNDRILAGLSEAQIIAVVLFAIGVLFLCGLRNSKIITNN